MNTVKLNAYAKLNLTLDLLGVEGGYHKLDSLVTTVDLFDRIVLKKRKDGIISVTMHGMGSEDIPPESNNAKKAGDAFVKAFNTTGADITVYKNIPIGAGMGGSSADVSGVLRGMAMLYEVEDEGKLKELADSLGSDTGYLLTGGYARMQGRGELVTPISGLPRLNFFVLVPPVGVSTGACYRVSDGMEKGAPCTEKCVELLQKGDISAFAESVKNDLERPAMSIEPAVQKAREEVESFSPLGTMMTGSGSAVFGVFETEELCAWAKSRYQGNFRAFVLRSVEKVL